MACNAGASAGRPRHGELPSAISQVSPQVQGHVWKLIQEMWPLVLRFFTGKLCHRELRELRA